MRPHAFAVGEPRPATRRRRTDQLLERNAMKRSSLGPCLNGALVVAFVASLPACGVETTGLEDDGVSGTSGALAVVANNWAWGTPGNNGADLPIGSSATQTCFLSGVSGDFEGAPFNAESSSNGLPTGPIKASAEVLDMGGSYFVRTRAGTGTGVLARVTCIAATANRTDIFWQDNLNGTSAPANPNTHCFLKKVWATTGLGARFPPLPAPRPHIAIEKVGGFFDMNGSGVDTFFGDREYGGATAVCVDFPLTSSPWTFTFNGPSSGSTTTMLRDSFPSGNPVPVANVACGLTGIAGSWINKTNDPQGWDDGAFLTADKQSASWTMTVSNGRSGSASCFR
jgi:hypothetical protein